MPQLQPGDPRRLGSYELLERLGDGGQGVVYLGRDASGNKAAIKLLLADLAGDDSARNRFVREAQAAKQVARFCTAQVLEADVAGDQPYIASEYVPGNSLFKQITDEGPITGASLERLGIGTLTALVAIHQAGIVHRDFKPHNVIMAPDGPRVIDFGIARALDAGQTSATKAIGTPSYMAPEQVAGAALTEAVDVWAWATTMVFAATGRPPFGDDTVVAVINRVMHEPPSLDGVPDDLRRLISACLVKEPERRPTAQRLMMTLIGAGQPDTAGETRMDEVAAATTLLAEGEHRAAGSTAPMDRTRAMPPRRTGPVGAPPGPPLPPARRDPGGYWEPEHKSRWPIVAGVGAIAALALVVALVMTQTGGNDPESEVSPSPSVSDTDTGTGDPTGDETPDDDPTPTQERTTQREPRPTDTSTNDPGPTDTSTTDPGPTDTPTGDPGPTNTPTEGGGGTGTGPGGGEDPEGA